METRKINIEKLQLNRGQVEGLPANPRQWKSKEFEELKRSIRECPELLDARGCLVYPHGGEFVVIGGNMRLSACKELKMREVPCIVLPEGLSVEKLREIAIKDNGSFGEWDFDLLANEWDALPLSEWGVNLPAFDVAGEDAEDDEVPDATTGEPSENYSVRLIFANQANKDYFLANKESIMTEFNCIIQ